MGKRKRSKSKDSEYEEIVKRLKKMEKHLKKKRRRKSVSSESESTHSSDHDADSPGEGPSEEILGLEGIFEDYLPAEPEYNEEAGNAPTQSTTPPEQAALEPSQLPSPPVNADGAKTNQPADDDTTPMLEPEILQLLGEDPTNEKKYGEDLHKDIAQRWSHILANGLPKDTQSELVKSYLVSANCTNMQAPKLNLEIKAALTEINIKKDLYSQSKQNQLASSLAAIGQVLNWALSLKNTVPQDMIKKLGDAGRLICDSHHRESLTRRHAILYTLNKNIRDTVKNTKIDENLFGADLSDHIKTSKAVTKTGSEIKATPRPPYRTPTVSLPQRGALNSRGAPRVAMAEPRPTPAPRRPPRDRRNQDATRGRRPNSSYTRHPTRRR